MPIDYKNLSGYILAGGKSSRMGRDKAFLEIDGKTFLQNAVDILTPICEDRVKVVLNKEQTHFIDKLPEGLPYIFDVYEDRGPVGGIHAALKDCGTKFAFILPVDVPFLTERFLDALINKSIKTDADVIVPRHPNGKTQQLCTVYKSKAALSVITKLLSDQQKSISVLKFINQLSRAKYLDLKDSYDQFENINKPSDYDKIIPRT